MSGQNEKGASKRLFFTNSASLLPNFSLEKKGRGQGKNSMSPHLTPLEKSFPQDYINPSERNFMEVWPGQGTQQERCRRASQRSRTLLPTFCFSWEAFHFVKGTNINISFLY